MPNRLLRLSPRRGDEGFTHIFSHTAHDVLTPLCSSLADELPCREQGLVSLGLQRWWEA